MYANKLAIEIDKEIYRINNEYKKGITVTMYEIYKEHLRNLTVAKAKLVLESYGEGKHDSAK